MNKKKFFLLMIACIGFVVNSYAQSKLKVAILDPVVVGEKLTDGLAISVREIESSSFVNNADNYAIVERSLIDKVMQEAKFSNSDAVDESQATRLGKLAGADKVVLTVISRFDNRCMFSIKLIDVESATIDRQISKLIDLASVLDITEPLTLAILGKGDANLTLPSSSSYSSNNSSYSQPSYSTPSTPVANTSSTSVAAPVSVPTQFNGTGVTFDPVGYEFSYMPDEFSLEHMGRLARNRDFNVVFDLSEATVDGTPLKKFVELMGIQSGVYPNMADECKRFVDVMNDWKDYNFGYFQNAPITLVVKVRNFDADGRENTSDYVLVDSATKQPLAGIRLKTKGGRFGSFANLFGDALEEGAAPKVKGKMKSAFKKFK